MNKEDAMMERKRLDKERENVWCPISGTWCKKECESYILARLVPGRGEFNVSPGYCNAYVLTGYKD